MNREMDSGKVRLAHDRRDERRQQVGGQRRDHAAKGRANHHAHRHIHHIAAQNELLKAG